MPNEIINNAISVDKSNLKDVKEIIKQIEKVILDNVELFKKANEIDLKNNNGFKLDFTIIKNIFSLVDKSNIYYGNILSSYKDEERKVIYGRQIMDIGNVVIINDGNTYVILELILRNIMAGNTMIFSNDGYMYGTNKLLIEIVQNLLERFSLNKYFIQMYNDDNYINILDNYSNIDLVIVVGDRTLQNSVLAKSRVKTIVSGYLNYDIYVDDVLDNALIDKINETGLNIDYYTKSDLKLDVENKIEVEDIDEAIGQINYSGSRYAVSIFTSSPLYASKFIREVKSKYITINTSPTINRLMDIKEDDLVIEKEITYPFDFEVSSRVEIGGENEIKE